MAASIIIGGDLCTFGRPFEYFIKGDVETLFANTLSDIQGSDIRLVNLECPLTNTENKLSKIGPCIKGEPSTFKGIKDAGFNLINLANNHILDYGEKGLRDTIEICKNERVDYLGAGKNLTEASKLYIKEINSIKIAILSMAEHEWSIAGKNSYGANPLDLIDAIGNIQKYSAQYDHLIIIIHGGMEDYPYPTPNMQKVARFFANQGASLVVYQHTHIAGCYEVYNDIPLIYGHGNLIFDKDGVKDNWHTGFLIKIILKENKKTNFSIIPYKTNVQGNGITKLESDEKAAFIDSLNKRSQKILDEDFVANRFLDQIEKKQNIYLRSFKNFTRFFRLFIRVFRLENLILVSNWEKRALAYLRCETHQESTIAILEQKDNKHA